MAKKTTTYECPIPSCSSRVTLHVKPTHAPTCSKHTGGGKVMKLVEK